jgi:ATP-dependent Clp protease ATP-binding subunit ClpC
MFERYTEKARRVIFFARYEASQFGTPFIETEHILLGLLREDREFMGKLGLRKRRAEIRKAIEERTPKLQPISTAVEMPLSQECKRVLPYAAEEATWLSRRQIGPEHLVLGLLREKRCVAAEILNRYGVTLEGARVAAGGIGWEKEGTPTEPQAGPQEQTRPDAAAVLARRFWREEACPPRDALVERASGRAMLYQGGEFDRERFDLSRNGWANYHCVICWKDLPALPPAGPAKAFTNGLDWVCADCYEDYLNPETDDDSTPD